MAKPRKWEYAVQEFRTVDAGGLQAAINKFVEDGGWELVSVNPPVYYFKRARPPEAKKHSSIYDNL
jgi:predicted urease superfamily metal-dependent hydrolase